MGCAENDTLDIGSRPNARKANRAHRAATEARRWRIQMGARSSSSWCAFSAICRDFVFTALGSVCYGAIAGKNSLKLRGKPFFLLTFFYAADLLNILEQTGWVARGCLPSFYFFRSFRGR